MSAMQVGRAIVSQIVDVSDNEWFFIASKEGVSGDITVIAPQRRHDAHAQNVRKEGFDRELIEVSWMRIPVRRVLPVFRSNPVLDLTNTNLSPRGGTITATQFLSIQWARTHGDRACDDHR